MPGILTRPYNLSSPRSFSEGWQYRDPQGVVYNLDRVIGRYVLSWDGDGMPPIHYVTQRGPFQHGETVNDFFLLPRIIQMGIRRQYNDRTLYWTGRNTFLNQIRPNRQLSGELQPGTLILTRPDATQRAIDVFVEDGPKFVARNNRQWDSFSFSEVIRWIAHNPVWYDPELRTLNFTIAGVDQLVFPITFPISFGSGILNANGIINYLGTWIEYPTIVITGPLTNPTITNTSTGEILDFDYAIPAGVTVTFSLAYGEKTVIDSLGNNLVGYLTSDSDLATFHIAPHPEVINGNNTINVSGSAATVATQVSIRYYTRYISI